MIQNKLPIFIINGVAQSGKDTFVQYLKDNYCNYIRNISTVDWVKHFCQIEYNINPNEKSLCNRAIWQNEKQSHKNYIFYNITNKINRYAHLIYFIHSREPEEIEKYKQTYKNCYSLFIDRPNIDIPDNISDELAYKSLVNYKYDIIINNDNDLEHFYKHINIFYNKYIKPII